MHRGGEQSLGDGILRRWEGLPAVELPAPVLDVLDRLAAEGYQAYVVGGAPRNLLWNVPVLDWDLATDAPLHRLQAWYPGPHPGLRFGAVRVGPHIDLTVLRKDLAYADGRHPEGIRPVPGIEEDLARRDFTVNAVAFNRQGVWSVEGALPDLAYRIWRTVGNPEEKFRQDALRVVRLARLAMTYGGSLEPETLAAARAECPRVRMAVSRERLWDELWQMMAADDWTAYDQVGLDTVYGRAGRRQPAWPRPQTAEARVLYWLMEEGSDSLDAALSWIGEWPIPRQQRVRLTAAARILWGRPDLERIAVMARLPGPASMILADVARSAGYARSLQPVHPVLTAVDLMTGWSLQGARLGQALTAMQTFVAEDPDRNQPSTLAQWLDAWLAATPSQPGHPVGRGGSAH